MSERGGLFRELHQFGVDANGTWYGADNVGGRIIKFKPRPGAPAAIGPSLALLPRAR